MTFLRIRPTLKQSQFTIPHCPHAGGVAANLESILNFRAEKMGIQGRRISKFCRRKECQFRLEARRIIQLFPASPDLAVRLSFFVRLWLGTNRIGRRRHLRPTDKRFLIWAFVVDGNILHTFYKTVWNPRWQTGRCQNACPFEIIWKSVFGMTFGYKQ